MEKIPTVLGAVRAANRVPSGETARGGRFGVTTARLGARASVVNGSPKRRWDPRAHSITVPSSEHV